MSYATRFASQRTCSSSSQPIVKTALTALMLTVAPIAVGSAFAQQSSTTWLDTLTVVGTRTELSVFENPASVSVVEGEQLERTPPTSIAEMLRDVPGIEVVDSSAPGMKRLRIRGESSRRVTILVDGQEITDHSSYGTPILVDPTNIERIEVVRGPASVLYGAKAIGGVINIITKRGAEKPVEFEVGGGLYSGSNGWQSWAALSGTAGQFDYRISGSLDDHGDRRVPKGQYTDTGRLDGSSYDNDNVSLHLGYRFGTDDNHYIALKAEQHRLSTESWTDPAYLTGGIRHFRIDLPQRDLRKVGLFYDGTDISDIVRKVHVDAYYQTVDRLFTNEVGVTQGPTMVDVVSTSDDRITNYGGTAQVDLQLHPDHYTIFGLHYLTDNLATNKTSDTVITGAGPFPINSYSEGFDDASIHTVSAFGQNEWSVTDTLKFIAGARFYHTRTVLNETTDADRMGIGSRNDNRFVASAGITYTGIENTTLRAQFSQGYIHPTLLQMFTDTSAGSGGMTYGNPDLDPETSWNVEIGARYNSGPLVLDAAAYYTRARNYISSLPCDADGVSCPAGWETVRGDAATYVNTDKATTYGVELTAEYNLNNGFTPYLSGAWTRRQLDFSSYRTWNSDTPALSGRLGVRWEGELFNQRAWADLFVRASSGVKLTTLEDGDLVTESLPAYGTLNFAFGGSFGDDDRFHYGIHINNIFDKEYRSSFDEIPGVGRSIKLTARMKF